MRIEKGKYYECIEDLGQVWGIEDKKIVVDFGWTEDNGYSQLILGTYVG